MKLSPVLFGLAMAAAGLAAPSVVVTEDQSPRIVGVDGPAAGAAPLVAARLSDYASGALGLVRSSAGRCRRELPVFGFGPGPAHVMTDGDGNLLTTSYGSTVRAIIWNRSTRSFFLHPVSGLRDGLPIAILAICLSIISICLLLRSMAMHDELAEALELGLAEQAPALPQGFDPKHRLMDKSTDFLDGPMRKFQHGVLGSKASAPYAPRAS